MNSIIIHGRLTRDPETKFYDGDKSVCKISVAVDRSFKDKDGKPVTDYFNCTCFGKRAETIDRYFKKGAGIIIRGEMQNNRYEKDGKMIDGWQIKINEFDFGSPSKKDSSQSAPPDSNAPVGFTPVDETTDDEELPF